MKFVQKPNSSKGVCAGCGKSTKLPVHGDCWKRFASPEETAKRKKRASDNKRRYKKGVIPPFSET